MGVYTRSSANYAENSRERQEENRERERERDKEMESYANYHNFSIQLCERKPGGIARQSLKAS